MARLKSVIFPEVMPATRVLTEGIFLRLALMCLAALELRLLADLTPSCVCKADLVVGSFFANLQELRFYGIFHFNWHLNKGIIPSHGEFQFSGGIIKCNGKFFYRIF